MHIVVSHWQTKNHILWAAYTSPDRSLVFYRLNKTGNKSTPFQASPFLGGG
jgi:hypothetical protein